MLAPYARRLERDVDRINDQRNVNAAASMARDAFPPMPDGSLETFPPAFRVTRLPILASARLNPLPVLLAISLVLSERGAMCVGAPILVIGATCICIVSVEVFSKLIVIGVF